MAAKLVAALALVVAASCDAVDREMYDDTPGVMDLMYPIGATNDNEQYYVDSLEQPMSTSRPPLVTSSHARKMTLYKMLQALRNHDASPTYLSVPKWIPTGTVLVPPDTFDYSPIRGPLGSLFKRSAGNNPRPPAQARLRWKIEKGKTGSHMICYFKLCALRSST